MLIDELNIHGLDLTSFDGAFAFLHKNKHTSALQSEGRWLRPDLAVALKERMAVSDWLALMGKCWGAFGDTTPHFEALRDALPQYGPVTQMMLPEEIDYWERLPDRILAYRGCELGKERDCCWTCSGPVATMYAVAHYQSIEPTVVSGWIDKRDVLAVRLRDFDEELIAFRFDICGIRAANPALAKAALETRWMQTAIYSYEEGTLNDYRQLYT